MIPSLPIPNQRDEILFKLTAAYSANFHSSMLFPIAVRTIGELHTELNSDERSVVALALNRCIEIPLQTVRKLVTERDLDPDLIQSKEFDFLWKYSCKILSTKTRQVIQIVREQLLPNSTSPQNRCFYKRMLTDYHRVLLVTKTNNWGSPDMDENLTSMGPDFTLPPALGGTVGVVQSMYEQCWLECCRTLPSLSVERLGAAVNYVTFLLEVIQDREKALMFIERVLEDIWAEEDTSTSKVLRCSNLHSISQTSQSFPDIVGLNEEESIEEIGEQAEAQNGPGHSLWSSEVAMMLRVLESLQENSSGSHE